MVGASMVPSMEGAWRDRTNLFISFRQSYAHHPAKRTRLGGPTGRFNDNEDGDSERAGLMSGVADGDAVIEMDVLPPRWLDIKDEIDTILSDAASKTRKLEQLHAKHVLPGFDDESVKAKEEREIEGLTQEITRGFVTCQNRIRKIDKMLSEQELQQGGIISAADVKMAQNLKISLATRVGENSANFRKKQSSYMKKLRSLNGMTNPIERASTPSLIQNPYTDPAMMDSEVDRSSAQSTLLQTAQVRRRTGVLDAAIEQREREIESIAQGVIDLSNIFQELNSMVIDQGSLLDRIDYNVERTAEHVQAADKELNVATGYQKRSTKRRIILLLILVVAGLFILLLVRPKRGTLAAPAEDPPTTPPAMEEGQGLGSEGERRIRWARRDGGPILEYDRSNRRWEWKQRRRRRSRLDFEI